MSLLMVGSVVKYFPTSDCPIAIFERILYIDGNQIISLRLFSEDWPTIRRRSEIEDDLRDEFAELAEYIPSSAKVIKPSPEAAHKRDRAWKSIRPIINPDNVPRIFIDSTFRARIIDQAIQTAKADSGKAPCKATMYKWLRRYWEGGMIQDALLPNYSANCGPRPVTSEKDKKRGAPRHIFLITGEQEGINVTPPIARKILQGARLYLKPGVSIAAAHKATLAHFFSVGVDENGSPILPPEHALPTVDQFKNWMKKNKNYNQWATLRQSQRKFNLKSRALLGNAMQSSFGPGSCYEIDATIANLYVVSAFTRNHLVGRPVIFFVVDRFSRLITGVSVSFEGPSWVGAMLAIENACMDKVEFCRKYGIDITFDEWPALGLPEKIVGDRGEMESKFPERLTSLLDIDIENLPPYRADLKGMVESTFGITDNEYIQWTPGRVVQDMFLKNDYTDAVLTMEEFMQILIYTILEFNANHVVSSLIRDEYMILDNVKPNPIDIWNYGIKNREGHLKLCSRDKLRYNLLPIEDAVVTPHGIRFKGMFYTCQIAEELCWWSKSRDLGRWKIQVCYDPRDTTRLYYESNDNIYELTLLPSQKRYVGRTLEEVEVLLFMEKMDKQLQKGKQTIGSSKLIGKILGIIAKAKEATLSARGQSGASNKEFISGIRDNKILEKHLRRLLEAWHLGSEKKDSEDDEAVLSSEDMSNVELPSTTSILEKLVAGL